MKDLNCLAGLKHVRQCYCAQSPFTLKKKNEKSSYVVELLQQPFLQKNVLFTLQNMYRNVEHQIVNSAFFQRKLVKVEMR